MRSILAICCVSLTLTSACDLEPELEQAPVALDPGHDQAPVAVDPVPQFVGAPHLAVAPSRSCVVTTPAGVVAVVASAGGLALAVDTGHADGPPLLVHRARGEGCALTTDGHAPVAASELLDADDRGNLYVYPAEAGSTGALSTMLPDEGPESMVARIDLDDHVDKLLAAGRGIWSFGVAPAGDALWVTACGPTGIFATADMSPAMPSPDTLWEQLPSVLVDRSTFWSVGLGTCDDPAALHPDCGYALVRTTPAGSEELGTTIVDLGAGFEQATLARCGADVCGLVSRGVIVWDRDGKVRRTISPADALAQTDEHIVQVSGSDRGVYVLLQGEADTRIVFVPTA